jgi:hypothetical protein
VGGSLSPRLVESIVRLGTWMPFERVPDALAFFTGVAISAETARRVTEAAGAALAAAETEEVEHLERDSTEGPCGPAVQQVSADGAMVPLCGGEWAEVKTVAIGTVAVAPASEPGAEPAIHARDLSYFSRLADAETFGRLALLELVRRGTLRAGLVLGVMDGSEWLQGFLDLHRPDAVRILDFPHAVEHLATAVQASLGAGTLRSATWLERQRHVLRHGDPAAVLVALCDLPVAAAPDPVAAEQARDLALGYFAKRWAQIQYAQFRQQGYPIGSGMVESANKLVVEARLKGSGMRWARANVNPMVALRAMACSDRWAETWPAICRKRREQATQGRRQRQQAKRAARPRAPADADHSLAPAVASDLQPEPAGLAQGRTRGAPPPTRPSPTTVDGRPTRHHPWKRPLLAGGRRHTAMQSKS